MSTFIERIGEYRRFPFVVLMSSRGHRRGYVGVKKDHELYGKGIGELPVLDVHGGISCTRGSESGYPLNMKDMWWFGFHCAHNGDVPEVCTEEYCVRECLKLASQLERIAVE